MTTVEELNNFEVGGMTTMTQLEEVKELEETIKRYAQSYYSGNAEVDDDYFDYLVDKLKEMSPESEVLNKTGWGYDPQGKKVSHLYGLKVGSLSKVKSVESIPERFSPAFCRVSAKLDGLSVVSYYNKGVRFKSITRGNGEAGQDVTDKINVISPDTFKLGYEFTGAVRGEVVMKNSTWKSIKESRFKDNPSANPRNFASGVLNRDEISEDLSLLNYVVYKVVADPCRVLSSSFNTDQLDFVKMTEFLSREFGKDSVPCTFAVPSSWTEEFMKMTFSQFSQEYPCDGIVLTMMDNIKYDKDCISHVEVAFKFEAESKEVVVTDVTWNATRTGRMMPRVWFDPVELSGAVVRKCTGFNAEFIKDNKINKGTVLRVCRSGEVIPHILEIVSNPCTEGLLTDTCPNCGGPLIWDGVDLVCPSENLDQLFYQFISTVGSIDGAGWSLYNSLIDLFEITSYGKFLNFLTLIKTDLDCLNQKVDSQVSGPVTRKKCKMILSKINSTIDPQTFLVGCNIAGISWKSAKSLLKDYPNFIKDVIVDRVNYDKIYEIPGLGNSAVTSLQSFEDRICDIATIVEVGDFVTQDEVQSQFSVAITGSLSMKRADFDALLQSKGITQGSNFKEIKYLITNNPDSTSSKMKKAKDSGVEVISEEEFTEKFLK